MVGKNYIDDYFSPDRRLIQGDQHGRAFSESFNSRFPTSSEDLGGLAFAQPAAFYGQTNIQNTNGDGLWRTLNLPQGGIVYYESMKGGDLRWFEGGPFTGSLVWGGTEFDGYTGQRMSTYGRTVILGEMYWTGETFNFVVKVSTDGGVNWVETALLSGTDPYPLSIDVAAAPTGKVYAVVGAHPGSWVLHCSEDGGKTFNQIGAIPVSDFYNSAGVTLAVSASDVAFITDANHNLELTRLSSSESVGGYYYFPSLALTPSAWCSFAVKAGGAASAILRNGAEVWSGPYLGSAAISRQSDLQADAGTGYWIAAPAQLSGGGGLALPGDQVGVLVSLDDGVNWHISPVPCVVSPVNRWSQMVDTYNGKFLVAHHEYSLTGDTAFLRVYTGFPDNSGAIDWQLIHEESRAYGYGSGFVTACRFTKE